jgi:hypothetical protein
MKSRKLKRNRNKSRKKYGGSVKNPSQEERNCYEWIGLAPGDTNMPRFCEDDVDFTDYPDPYTEFNPLHPFEKKPQPRIKKSNFKTNYIKRYYDWKVAVEQGSDKEVDDVRRKIWKDEQKNYLDRYITTENIDRKKAIEEIERFRILTDTDVL